MWILPFTPIIAIIIAAIFINYRMKRNNRESKS